MSVLRASVFAVIAGAGLPAVAQAPADTPAAAAAPPTTGGTEAPAPPPPAANVGVGVPVVGGNGFALSADGRSRLHVGIDTGAGFDSNPYSVPLAAAQAFDLALRLRPHADVDYPGSTLAFRGEAMVDYGYLPGVFNQRTSPQVGGEAPGQKSLIDYFLLYQSLFGASLEVNRGGTFSVGLGDDFSWNSDPGNVIPGLILNRINNNLRAGVGVRPGGGALDLKLTYNFGFTRYLDVQSAGGCLGTGCLDNMLHAAELRADYKFLPRTGVFASVNGGWSSYPLDDTNTNPQAFPVGALVGVQGQLLAKVSGLASLGYQNPLVIDVVEGGGQGIATAGLVGAVGQAELQWQPSPLTKVGGGFQRTFAPAPIYQFLGNDRFYVSVTQMLAGRFLLGVNGGFSILEFGEEQLNSTDRFGARENRLDGHLDGDVSVSYFFTDWMSLGVVNKLDWHLSNANDPETATNLSFLRNQTFVLASLAY